MSVLSLECPLSLGPWIAEHRDLEGHCGDIYINSLMQTEWQDTLVMTQSGNGYEDDSST